MNKNFFKLGYITIDEYVGDIFNFLKNDRWKLPLSFFNYLYLLFLKFFVIASPLKNFIFLKNISYFSPSYAILINYLKKNNVLSNLHSTNSGSKIFYRFNSNYIFEGSFENDFSRLNASGSDYDPEVALSKCLGEMIERRISCLDPDFEKVTLRDTLEGILNKKLEIYWPQRHHKYTKENIINDKRLYKGDNQVFRWVRGVNMNTNKKVYIPHQLVFWRHSLDKKTFNESIIHDLTTNGCAGYFDRDTAIRNGLQEVVQRDGFLCYWLCKISPDIIDKNTLPDALKDVVKEIESIGLIVTILDITTDINIPNVCIHLETVNESNKMISVTAGTSTNYYKSIESGLKESVICGGNLYNGPGDHVDKDDKHIKNIGHTDRMKMYLKRENIKKIKWFTQGKIVSYSSIENNLVFKNAKEDVTHFVSILSKKGVGYEPVFYEYKHKILSKIGYHVVRVFIEKCFPLYLYENNATNNSDRLKDFSMYKKINFKKVNTEPHPFP